MGDFVQVDTSLVTLDGGEICNFNALISLISSITPISDTYIFKRNID